MKTILFAVIVTLVCIGCRAVVFCAPGQYTVTVTENEGGK